MEQGAAVSERKGLPEVNLLLDPALAPWEQVLVTTVEQVAGPLFAYFPAATDLDIAFVATSLPEGQEAMARPELVRGAVSGRPVDIPVAAYPMQGLGDPNGAAPDMLVTLDPGKQPRQIADGWIDDVLAHEILHGLGFYEGKGDGIPTPFGLLVRDGRFTGPRAMELNGGPVPLDAEHRHHLAMAAFPSDLMNPFGGRPLAFDGPTGADYPALDIAILLDSGYAGGLPLDDLALV